MRIKSQVARLIAQAFLAGEFNLDEMVGRATIVLGKRFKWLRHLARQTIHRFGLTTRPTGETLARYLLNLRVMSQAVEDYWWVRDEFHVPKITRDLLLPSRMIAAQGKPSTWQLPNFPDLSVLADWLGISMGSLQWLANQSLPPRTLRQQGGKHYHYRWVPKRSGGLRLIESPKPQLKSIQRELLHQLLDQIPPHSAAHGFQPGRSIKTFAEAHTAQRVVIRIDLANFFATITAQRILPIFLTTGYPEAVARCLTGLCTNQLSESMLQPLRYSASNCADPRLKLYSAPHLPQGAPTSPALANLCAYRLDCRLTRLALAASATYTRYADDLVFSGGEALARSAKRFVVQAMSFCELEGFTVQPRKTRIMRSSVRQQIAGVVVNEKLNVRRADYDRLKATLFNCVKQGPESQNRAGHADFRAHLAGAISHVTMLNPERGQRLDALFQQIRWPNQ